MGTEKARESFTESMSQVISDIDRLKERMALNLPQYTMHRVDGKPYFVAGADRDMYDALCRYQAGLIQVYGI